MVNKLTTDFAICTSGQTGSALSQLDSPLMRCSLPMVNGWTTLFTICTNGNTLTTAFTICTSVSNGSNGQTDSALLTINEIQFANDYLIDYSFYHSCTNGQTDSTLSQSVSLLMRCSLPMVIRSTTLFIICTNGTGREAAFTTLIICTIGMDRDAAFLNGIRACVLDMNECF